MADWSSQAKVPEVPPLPLLHHFRPLNASCNTASYLRPEKSLSAWRMLAAWQRSLCCLRWVGARSRLLLPNIVSTFLLCCAAAAPFALGKTFLPDGGEVGFWKGKQEEERGSSTMAGQDTYSSKWYIQVNGIILCAVGLLDVGWIVHRPLRCACKCVHLQLRRVENYTSC